MATEERVLCVRSEFDESGGVRVSVKDTEKSFEPSAIDRIFDPLFTTTAHGMGTGLSICRSIIEAHGRQLWVTANLPQRAIFHFRVLTHPDSTAQ
jgi:signal transduction histidine kinase